MVSKKDIRNSILSIRSNISKKEWEEKSHKIYQQVITHPFFMEADEIYSYVDFRMEAGTRNLMKEALKLGKKVAVPRIEKKEMYFYYIDDFSQLKEGTFGILEPTTLIQAKSEHALIVMPGAAFDKKRNRIGYGGGYYDRYLEKYPNCHTAALAFEFQIVETIECEPFDIRPEIIITEEKVYV